MNVYTLLRWIAIFSLLGFLTSCVTYTESPPFFIGTFVGYYQTGDEAVPIGIRIETTLVSVTEKRYEFSGTARLGEEVYSVSGHEDAGSNLGYLSPQYLPPLGYLSVQLRDEAGSAAFCILTDVRYDEYPEEFTYGTELSAGSCLSPQPYARLVLEKQT